MMAAFLVMLKHIAIYVGLTLPGYLLVKFHGVKTERTGVLSKLLLYVATPSLIVTSIVKYVPFYIEHLPFILTCVAIGFIFTLIIYFISKPLTFYESGIKQGMSRFCMCFGSLLSIPLSVSIFGASMVTTAVTIVSSVMSSMLFPLGTVLIKNDWKMFTAKHAFFNPVFIGIIIGVVLNLIHIQNFFPELIIYPTVLSGLVTPISMIVLGMKLGESKISSLLKAPLVHYVSIMRIVVFPTILCSMLIGLSFIPAFGNLFTNDVILGSFIAFVAPTTGFASTLAAHYHGDVLDSNSEPLATAYTSLITLPILYAILVAVLGIL